MVFPLLTNFVCKGICSIATTLGASWWTHCLKGISSLSILINCKIRARMLLNQWSSFQGRSTHVFCNLVQMPQADHGETLGRICRARKDVWQAGGGFAGTPWAQGHGARQRPPWRAAGWEVGASAQYFGFEMPPGNSELFFLTGPQPSPSWCCCPCWG